MEMTSDWLLISQTKRHECIITKSLRNCITVIAHTEYKIHLVNHYEHLISPSNRLSEFATYRSEHNLLLHNLHFTSQSINQSINQYFNQWHKHITKKLSNMTVGWTEVELEVWAVSEVFCICSQPGLASFIGAKDDGSSGGNRSCKTCKAPVRSSSPTNQLLTGRMSSLSPSNRVRALKGKWRYITILNRGIFMHTCTLHTLDVQSEFSGTRQRLWLGCPC